jgi:hypothetical protein
LSFEGCTTYHTKAFKEVNFQLCSGRIVIIDVFQWERDLVANLAISNCNDVRNEHWTCNACRKVLVSKTIVLFHFRYAKWQKWSEKSYGIHIQQ